MNENTYFFTVKTAADRLGVDKTKLGRAIRKNGLVFPNIGTTMRPIYIILPNQILELEKII